jgi:hypothetical protein
LLFSNIAFAGTQGLWDKKWVFMVYMDADCDVEEYAIQDFLEMAEVGSTQDVAIIVQMDRHPGYNTSYGDWIDCKRFYVTKGLIPTPEHECGDLGEVNMGDPEVLIDFVEWGACYHAEHYALVLWDHGGAWKGVCQDYSQNYDLINMTELRYAMASIKDILGKNIDVLVFHACLMSSLEVVYQIRDTTDIMVGSAEGFPAWGFPYNIILANLTANPSMSPATLSSLMVHSCVESFHDEIKFLTVSAFNVTSTISSLVPAVTNFAKTLMGSLTNYKNETFEAVRSTEFYMWISGMKDLYDFAYQIQKCIPASNIQNATQSVMEALSVARIAEAHAIQRPFHGDTIGGLSIYLTYHIGQDPRYYPIDFVNNTNWDEFLQTLKENSPAAPVWADLNGDGVVDIRDIAIVSKAFGSEPGDPNWNPIADVNEDGKVDMRDVALVARYYGYGFLP